MQFLTWRLISLFVYEMKCLGLQDLDEEERKTDIEECTEEQSLAQL